MMFISFHDEISGLNAQNFGLFFDIWNPYMDNFFGTKNLTQQNLVESSGIGIYVTNSQLPEI